MPDLGKYAVSVLSAYGAAIVLIVALVMLSIRRGRRVKNQLDEVERKVGKHG